MHVVTARAQAARKAMLNAIPVSVLREIWDENLWTRDATIEGVSKRELIDILTFNWDAVKGDVFNQLERLAENS